jgi:Na+/H+ antiporter NhaA
MSENKLVQQWKQFIQTDARSGIILVLAALLASNMANSFIGSLAFEEQWLVYQTQVKVAVLLGSLISAVTGAYLLTKSSKKVIINQGDNNKTIKI